MFVINNVFVPARKTDLLIKVGRLRVGAKLNVIKSQVQENIKVIQ